MPASGVDTPMYCCEVRWRELRIFKPRPVHSSASRAHAQTDMKKILLGATIFAESMCILGWVGAFRLAPSDLNLATSIHPFLRSTEKLKAASSPLNRSGTNPLTAPSSALGAASQTRLIHDKFLHWRIAMLRFRNRIALLDGRSDEFTPVSN